MQSLTRFFVRGILLLRIGCGRTILLSVANLALVLLVASGLLVLR
ncbi:hypothetical protein Ae331Ps2_5920c [Pseudonocardia sp. Ae331_Ps2]|nr:hypothetical protein Ae331Ps2_5920c [Pseudonocardia sp. Ae331_Ps2]